MSQRAKGQSFTQDTLVDNFLSDLKAWLYFELSGRASIRGGRLQRAEPDTEGEECLGVFECVCTEKIGKLCKIEGVVDSFSWRALTTH